MAFMERLGLWGPSTSFSDFGTFASTIRNRGIGAFELLAMEMKAKGSYVSLSLSLSLFIYLLSLLFFHYMKLIERKYLREFSFKDNTYSIYTYLSVYIYRYLVA